VPKSKSKEYMVVDHTSMTNEVELEGNLSRHAERGWQVKQMNERFVIFER